MEQDECKNEHAKDGIYHGLKLQERGSSKVPEKLNAPSMLSALVPLITCSTTTNLSQLYFYLVYFLFGYAAQRTWSVAVKLIKDFFRYFIFLRKKLIFYYIHVH